MAASTVTEHYDSTPEAAWALVGDFNGIGELFDGVTDVTIDGDTRTFSLMGMRLSEKMIARDDATRTLTYSIIDGIAIDAHEATIHVEGTDGGCEIAWSVTAEPEAAQPLFADSYKSALKGLHASLDPS